MRMLDNKIMVESEKTVSKIGNLVIPDTAAHRPLQGKVIAVGRGRMLPDGTIVPMQIKIGDVVLYAKHSGDPVFPKKIIDKHWFIMREDEVLAIME